MSEVRRRVRSQNRVEAEALRSARKSMPAGLRSRVKRLQARTSDLRASVAELFDMPPEPPTLRGRAGALAVRLIRHSLFWLIPNLQAVHEQFVAAVGDQAKTLEDVVKALEQTNARMDRLAREPNAAEAARDSGPA